MIYRHTVGHPSYVPKEVTHKLGEVRTHYQSGTQWVVYYTDDPTSEADKAEFEADLARSLKINQRDWPIWV